MAKKRTYESSSRQILTVLHVHIILPNYVSYFNSPYILELSTEAWDETRRDEEMRWDVLIVQKTIISYSLFILIRLESDKNRLVLD